MNAFTWAALSACIWGVAPLLEKRGLGLISPQVGLFYRTLGVSLGIFILGVFTVTPAEIKSADLKSAGFVMLGGFLASIVGQMCFYQSLKIGEVSKMVLVSGSYPVIAFLLGVLLLNESLTPLKLLGMALVATGLWILRLR